MEEWAKFSAGGTWPPEVASSAVHGSYNFAVFFNTC